MLIKQDAGIRKTTSLKKNFIQFFLLLCVGFISPSLTLYGNETILHNIIKNPEGSRNSEVRSIQVDQETLTYYLNVSDFALSFIQIPTSNVSSGSSTTSSTYLAGRAPLYNQANEKVGTCSASFLCMQNSDGIFTDISNYISVDNGLIVTWFTPTKLINLELDTIINSMVTECMVLASTKVGVSPFYGQTFNLIVSSENGKIYFQFTRTGTIF